MYITLPFASLTVLPLILNTTFPLVSALLYASTTYAVISACLFPSTLTSFIVVTVESLSTFASAVAVLCEYLSSVTLAVIV